MREEKRKKEDVDDNISWLLLGWVTIYLAAELQQCTVRTTTQEAVRYGRSMAIVVLLRSHTVNTNRRLKINCRLLYH